MNKRWTTAAELMKEMAADPVISQRLKEKSARREKRTQASRAALEPVLRKAQALGFRGETIEDIVRNNAPLLPPLVAAFLSSLDGLEPRQQETIVRALGAAERPFDAARLVDLFDRSGDHALKWAIVNTFALNKPHGTQQWLERIRGTSWEKTFEELGGED